MPVHPTKTQSFNPYQAPLAVNEQVVIEEAVGRTSAKQLKSISRGLIVTEIAYVVSWLVFFAFCLANYRVIAVEADLLWMLYLCCLAITWISFADVMTHCRGFASLPYIFAFLIPAVGMLVFFESKKYAIRFMRWNGYRPCFVGVEIDKREVEKMNKDENYVPSAFFDIDGRKRRKNWQLSETFIFAVIALFMLASVAAVFAANR